MMWIILALFIPIYIAWVEGSSYAGESLLIIVGVIQYIIFCVLETFYIKRRTPESPLIYKRLNITPRIDVTELVPRWVVVIGLIGAGLVPAGIINIILLWCGIIEYTEWIQTYPKQ